MKEVAVELIRRFAPLASRKGHWDFLYFAPGKPQRWHEIEDERRVLILADPGAGKTYEAMSRARKLRQRGKEAFFIRIEAIDATFEKAFEVGSGDEFVAWLASNEEAKRMIAGIRQAGRAACARAWHGMPVSIGIQA